MFLAVATGLFDEPVSSKGKLSGPSTDPTELSSELATQDTRYAISACFQIPVAKKWTRVISLSKYIVQVNYVVWYHVCVIVICSFVPSTMIRIKIRMGVGTEHNFDKHMHISQLCLHKSFNIPHVFELCRLVNKVSRGVAMEDWLGKLYAELNKQGITIPERYWLSVSYSCFCCMVCSIVT